MEKFFTFFIIGISVFGFAHLVLDYSYKKALISTEAHDKITKILIVGLLLLVALALFFDPTPQIDEAEKCVGPYCF